MSREGSCTYRTGSRASVPRLQPPQAWHTGQPIAQALPTRDCILLLPSLLHHTLEALDASTIVSFVTLRFSASARLSLRQRLSRGSKVRRFNVPRFSQVEVRTTRYTAFIVTTMLKRACKNALWILRLLRCLVRSIGWLRLFVISNSNNKWRWQRARHQG